MSTDIHSFVEKHESRGWVQKHAARGVFWAPKNYKVYDWLAGARGEYKIKGGYSPRGLPNDTSKSVKKEIERFDLHHVSWISVKKLLETDYEQPVVIDFGKPEIRTVVAENPELGPYALHSMSYHVEIGPSQKRVSDTVRRMTLREFLGKEFFEDLELLRNTGAERVVFGFDS